MRMADCYKLKIKIKKRRKLQEKDRYEDNTESSNRFLVIIVLRIATVDPVFDVTLQADYDL